MKVGQMKKGFTIIETLLVLSISALFAVGMLIGWNRNVERARYEDAVTTFKSDLQAVFDEVKNPTNSRSVKVKCNTSTVAVSLSVDNTTGQDRGSSNCVLLGKLILFSSPKDINWYASEDYTVIDIIGKDIDISKDCSGPCNNSIDAIKATKLTLSVSKNQVTRPTITSLEWGSTYKTITDNRVTSGANRKFSGNFIDGTRQIGISINKVILVRSPLDGSVLAFGLDNYAPPLYGKLGTATVKDIHMLYDEQFVRIAASIDERLLITPEHKVSICVRGQFTGNGFGGKIVGGLGNKNKVIHISGGDSSDIEIDSLDAADGSYCDNADGRIYPEDAFNGNIVIDGVKI